MKAIAVIGSSSGLKESEGLAQKIGNALAKKGIIVVTGAGSGLPLIAAAAAKKAGAMTIGISPAQDVQGHKKMHPGQPNNVFDFIVYSGFGLKGRNVLLIRSAPAAIMIGGSIGTINEFTIAYDEGKVIGVLEGSGGATKLAKQIDKLGKAKKTGAKVIYSKDPKALVEKVCRLI
jgi:uncharacterized protein (TIGR00725 family)